MQGAPAIYEGFVDFSHEVSVIAARNAAGDVGLFDPGENVHEDGILRTHHDARAPAPAQRSDAVLLAGANPEQAGLCRRDGGGAVRHADGLIVNEIAPRVHNSGHWTQNGCTVDQFEQHIRAVAGWPLGDGSRHANVVMENLIGDDMDRVPELARDGGCALHLYGKAECKPGRKMGHVNRVTRG